MHIINIEEQLLSNQVQSAYKRFHSTETALLKIHNDIICNMDNGKVTALTLLDLSAAFDTIDHSTLLERLYGHFGISCTVFKWFKSYISNRQERVHIDGSLSCPQDHVQRQGRRSWGDEGDASPLRPKRGDGLFNHPPPLQRR